MTKAEIMIELIAGNRVTHAYFSKDEFIQIVNHQLVDERGLILNNKAFWDFRKAPMFDDGWELYHEPESRGIAGVYENAIGPENPDIIITEAQPEEPVNVTLTDYSKMPELAPEPEYIAATGSMPVLEWFLNLFRRKKNIQLSDKDFTCSICGTGFNSLDELGWHKTMVCIARRSRKLTKNERMEEYEKDNEPIS